MSEVSMFWSVMVFLAFLGFMSTITPPEYAVVSPFNFVVLGGSFIGVAGSCAIATGLPCAVALVVFGLLNIIGLFVTGFSWLKTVLFIPLSMVILYLAIRIARGGG
jgi:hypothetical protein